MTQRPYASMTAQMYEDRLVKVVRSIREMADRIERDGKPRKDGLRYPPGMGRFLYAAQEALHAFTWDSANTNIDYLVSAAAEADQAEREEAQSVVYGRLGPHASTCELDVDHQGPCNPLPPAGKL